MAITPEEIETKQFVRVLRGYDPVEVESFLRAVAAEMRRQAGDAPAGAAGVAADVDEDVAALLQAAYRAAARSRRTTVAAAPSATRRRAQRPITVTASAPRPRLPRPLRVEGHASQA